MHTREKFDQELQQLSDSIMLMASRVEEELSIVLAAYERLDPMLASVVTTSTARSTRCASRSRNAASWN